MIIFRHANFLENLVAFSLCLIPLKITTTCQTGKKSSVQLQNRYDLSVTGLYRKTMTEMVNSLESNLKEQFKLTHANPNTVGALKAFEHNETNVLILKLLQYYAVNLTFWG